LNIGKNEPGRPERPVSATDAARRRITARGDAFMGFVLPAFAHEGCQMINPGTQINISVFTPIELPGFGKKTDRTLLLLQRNGEYFSSLIVPDSFLKSETITALAEIVNTV
jgi:hypothetical protein